MRAETSLQSVVMAWLRLQERQGRLVAFPVPNSAQIAGGTAQERAKRVALMKRLGLLRPGVPDICVLLPIDAGARAFLIELKLGPGKLSPDQLAFTAALDGIGGDWIICRSLEDVQRIIEPLITPQRAA